MPRTDVDLVVAPTYRFAETLNKPRKPDPDADRIRNVFHSAWRRCAIIVFTDDDGKVRHGKSPRFNHASHELMTMAVSDVWGVEQESKALQLLATMVKHFAFKRYLLTGCLLESSPRSGVTYMFRRLRPTIALAPHPKRDEMRILCTLCMHPIAYYRDTWAGAMCPTDDVIAHLSLMRGDEHRFWKVSNQHPPHLPEAGL